METAVPVTHPALPVSRAASGEAELTRFARGGWRPALGWALTPCALYAFIVGPLLRRPSDAAELVALFAAAGVLIAARTFEKTQGLA